MAAALFLLGKTGHCVKDHYIHYWPVWRYEIVIMPKGNLAMTDEPKKLTVFSDYI
jgi:hypothetical protein